LDRIDVLKENQLEQLDARYVSIQDAVECAAASLCARESQFRDRCAQVRVENQPLTSKTGTNALRMQVLSHTILLWFKMVTGSWEKPPEVISLLSASKKSLVYDLVPHGASYRCRKDAAALIIDELIATKHPAFPEAVIAHWQILKTIKVNGRTKLDDPAEALLEAIDVLRTEASRRAAVTTKSRKRKTVEQNHVDILTLLESL
jgi:hypothetical protein